VSRKGVLAVLAIIIIVSVLIYYPLLGILKDERYTAIVGMLSVFGFYYIFLRHFW